MAHIAMMCDFCAQTDDHPKVHAFPEGTYHHDCLSASLRDQVIATNQHGKSIIEAAQSGTHGDELRAHIQGLEQPAHIEASN